MKECSNGLGHMTHMAAMPIYGKNLKKSSSLKPKGWWLWKLVCSIGHSSTTKFVLRMTLSLVPYAFVWEKDKTMGFSETIVVCEMQSTKWVDEALWVPKIKVIHWPSSKSLRFNIFKLLFLNNHWADWSQILCRVSFGLGNESLFKWFRSHYQDGHYVHIR